MEALQIKHAAVRAATPLGSVILDEVQNLVVAARSSSGL
jgi:hypothetical protein